MWTVLGLDDFSLLERHVAIMQEMDERYGTLSVPKLRSGMSRRESELHRYEADGREIVLALCYSRRRKAFYLWSVGIAGDWQPREALDCIVARLESTMADRNMREIYAIRPRKMDHQGVKELHELVPLHPDIRVSVVDESDAAVMWRIETRRDVPLHTAAAASHSANA